MSDTPETDNLARGNHVVPTEWAEQLERERDEAREKATHAWEDNLRLDTENRRLERKLEELRLAYNRVVGEPPLKFRRIT